MDSGSNSGRLNAVASRSADGAKVVGIDQAIFTCIRTPMGQGYRVVAASRGLRAKESSEIVTHAPSGDGLCDEGPEPVGISFYPLQSGRFCILHSRYAGAEPTGRGGQRAYTRAFVLDAEQLARFGNSPFQVLRAAYAAGT
ncbi:MAG: hypothetical protein JXA69_01270, partial [Phycisphaerae bacterium]|nr:hypothetical protein [Phycisphaerae bacterium]